MCLPFFNGAASMRVSLRQIMKVNLTYLQIADRAQFFNPKNASFFVELYERGVKK